MRAMTMMAGLALAALAAAPGAGSAKKGEAASGAERQICKSKAVIGSRLARVRECHTALEWQEMKSQEQQGLSRKQVNGDPGCNGCAGSVGRDSPW